MFDPSSRYYAIGNAEHVTETGDRLIYKKRRFLPQRQPRPTDRQAVVRAGERLDTIAARMLGDPLQFWRIADSSSAMNPFDLAEPGKALEVPAIGLSPAGGQ
jgi:hypothetical protein